VYTCSSFCDIFYDALLDPLVNHRNLIITVKKIKIEKKKKIIIIIITMIIAVIIIKIIIIIID